MQQSRSAQHIQALPRNGTNKKDFQLRSDDMYPERNIYILVLNRYQSKKAESARG